MADEPLVQLTEKAAEKVKEIKASEGVGDDHKLRLRIVGGGCSGFSYDLYFDDTSVAGDQELDCHGVAVVVDPMSLQYLAGTTIDYVDGLQGSGFRFNNPNVKATCGCGSSFNV